MKQGILDKCVFNKDAVVNKENGDKILIKKGDFAKFVRRVSIFDEPGYETVVLKNGEEYHFPLYTVTPVADILRVFMY